MDIQERVYCKLYGWQLKQVDEKLVNTDIETVKGIKRMMEQHVQDAFDKGRRFEQDKKLTKENKQ